MRKRTVVLMGVPLGLLLGAQAMMGMQGNGRLGRLVFEIRDADSQALLPGKLVFLKDGQRVDLGVKSEGMIASRRNVVYTANGRGSIQVPKGRYEVWAGRGVEYSADVQQIEIVAGDTVHLVANIRREVQTPGFVCGDMHLHTRTFSSHGDATVPERIISCLAEGLEWAVATDHNHHTDYDTVKQTLDMAAPMATTVGNEVSTPIGHFNAYPLPPSPALLPHQLRDARKLFKLIHDMAHDAVIQVNHPRWPGAAYFTELDLDPNFAISNNPRWSWDFDAFEILNENRGLGWFAEQDNPISVRQDWFNMLNRGQRFTGVGNSDSHDVEKLLAGMPRNYIASSTDDPAAISETELVENIKRHRVSVSRGPYIEFTANDGVPIGRETRTVNGKVRLHIRVQAAHWVRCDTVRIIGNGEVVQTILLQNQSRAVRFEGTVTLQPTIDTWYMVEATGSKSMAPLVPDAPVPIMPLAFTNPIWVDADGDGRFTALREYAAQAVRALQQQPERLADSLASHPQLLKQAVAFLVESELPNRGALLAALLPQADLDLRLSMYPLLAASGSSEAREALRRAAERASGPVEKLVIALARFKHGETDAWTSVVRHVSQVQDERYLQAAFKSLQRRSLAQTWYVIGPFAFAGDHGLDAVFAPEQRVDLSATIRLNENEWRWQKHNVHGNEAIDFMRVFGRQEHVVAYAHAEFVAHRSGEIILRAGSDDGIAIWINGREVHRHHVHRGLSPGDDTFVVPVRRGKTRFWSKWKMAVVDGDSLSKR
ncbi:MAG: CehA/McbA family metallohydrolase [candidate division KSB1 bacterium]|nr:CehA/McbA family metallohydrolase [candidate division KSB1 bacterium]